MKPRKVTGELKLFKSIWQERPHKCEVCDKKLDWFNVTYFMHLLSKGSHPNMRLEKDNIAIGCYNCHFTLDHETHKAKADPRYEEIFNKIEELRTISNGKTT